jgi:PAS domain S-box-containing protein
MARDGSEKWVEAFSKQITFNGDPALQGMIIEITDRIKAEQTLEETESTYRDILDSANDMIAIQDINTGEFLYMNAETERATGYSFEEFKKLGVAGFSPPTEEFSMEKAAEALENAILGEPQVFEWGFIDKKGTFHPTEVSLKVANVGGEERLISVSRDITERKQAEEALRESEETFRTLTSLSPVGMYATDAKGNCVYVNQRWCQIAGMTQEEAMGEGWKNSVHPEDKDTIIRSWDEMIGTHGTWGKEYRFMNKDGKVTWIYGLATPLNNERGEISGYIGINLNITQRKIAEQEQERLMHELEKSRKELQRITYVASHDLRSPLVNIQGFSEELAKGLSKMSDILERDDVPSEVRSLFSQVIAEDVTEALHYIQSSIEKMDSLIKGLLQISRFGTAVLNLSNVDVNLLMRKIRDTFEYRLKEDNISLTVEELPSSRADENQIDQVFSNLLDNAIKYQDKNRKGEIVISGWSENNSSIYSFRDNGIGISRNLHERIFEIFQRIDKVSVPGEGLGLTAVKRIVDRHGGKIWVESETGEGSIFFVSLPGPE